MNSGGSAMFNCTISESPMDQVTWFQNGQILRAGSNERFKWISPLVLYISNVTRHDRGMYQCIARNERETAEGSAELRLGGKCNFISNYCINFRSDFGLNRRNLNILRSKSNKSATNISRIVLFPDLTKIFIIF